jgi:restriction endonuclease Mrr
VKEILAAPAPLGTYKPFSWLMGTNHRILDTAVVAALDEAIGPRLRPLGQEPAPPRESQVDLDNAIKNAERQAARALAQAVAGMDPIAFEWLVRAVLAALGYVDVVVTKPSNDKGVDVRARLVSKGVASIPTAVQVKRTPSVDRPTVQKLRGALSAHESGLIVTSGRFTPAAEEEARDPTKTPIALLNGTRLIELLLEFGIGARQKTYKVYSVDRASLTLESLKERAAEATEEIEA